MRASEVLRRYIASEKERLGGSFYGPRGEALLDAFNVVQLAESDIDAVALQDSIVASFAEKTFD